MLDGDLLLDIASGIAAARTLWEPAGVPDPVERRCVRLLATDDYEVWVLAWAPGQAAELHDHGDAAGAVVVVEGTLTERAVEADGVRTTELPAGAARLLAVGLVHEVANESAAGAVSIHVYSPPLRTMTRYDESLEPLVTQLVPVEAPDWAVPVESLLAHPSLG